MRFLRNLFVGLAISSIWPALLGLGAYAARQAPWPRSAAVPVSVFLGLLALASMVASMVRWLFGPGGWAEDVLSLPRPVSRQVRRAGVALVGAHVLFLSPCWLINQGYLAPGGRPISAPSVERLFILAFELSVLAICIWSFHGRSALVSWLAESPPAALRWLARNRRLCSAALLAGIAGVIILDVTGFSYSSRRLSNGAAGSLFVAIACWGVYRVLLRIIDDHAWQWIRVGQALKGKGGSDEDAGMPDDLAGRLRSLSGYLTAGFGLLGAAWVWDLDLALFRFISEQQLWRVATGQSPDGKEVISVFITVGDLVKAFAIFGITAALWRHLSTAFAVAVFPRIPDDPGIRFALVTLCRYLVLGVGTLLGLSAIHLGLEKIGMVLAALGVGLGFGLQEIVSNFVCGIILLLERPIRVGDIVTVSNMNGTVDRINIRATTIINGDNQSIIVPNRAFITGDLINWTLKDKIIRVSVRVRVAYGNDPDKVSELLLDIARQDPDVLRNPVPSALVEEMNDTGLSFLLSVHVPEPGLAGRVKHRLMREIQLRFASHGVQMSMPTQKLIVNPNDLEPFRGRPGTPENYRVDPGTPVPPAPLLMTARPVTTPVEESHRGVDE